ncbi:MAG TPA: hypothetical protein VKR62_11690 [Roseiarcus sp.]|nr:hypothetical protein [Roseiarcus sp.]
MLMIAALEGKTLATPVPPLVIEIVPGLGPASVLIFSMPPGAAYGGESIASPDTSRIVEPTTVTGLFVGEKTSTVVVIGGGLGPITICALARLPAASEKDAISRLASSAMDFDCPRIQAGASPKRK